MNPPKRPEVEICRYGFRGKSKSLSRFLEGWRRRCNNAKRKIMLLSKRGSVEIYASTTGTKKDIRFFYPYPSKFSGLQREG